MNVPVSLLFFVLTGVAYAIQAFPLTGFFLMFLLAPFWSVLLVNAGMAGIAGEVLFRRVPPVWIALPVLYFGGYAHYAGNDQRALAELQAEISAANARAAVRFDPTAQSLVLDGSSELAAVTSTLVQTYRISTVYEALQHAPGGYLAHRLAPEPVCDYARQQRFWHASVRTMPLASAREAGRRDRDRSAPSRQFCLLTVPEPPPYPAVLVRRTRTSTRRDGLPVALVTTEITDPAGRRATLRSGTASPLYRWPMPVLGFAMESTTRWENVSSWSRADRTPLAAAAPGERPEALLAGALRLSAVPPEQRDAAAPAALEELVDAAAERVVQRELAQLDELLRHPAKRRAETTLDVLSDRPALLRQRVPALLSGVEQAAAADWRGAESGRILATLLAAAPDDVLLPHRTRLLGLYERYRGKHWLPQTDALLARLGLFGPPALPVLLERLNDAQLAPEPALRSICELGPAAAPAAAPVLARRWQQRDTRVQRDADLLLYVTLLRLGRRDIAGEVRAGGRREPFQDAWRRVTPGSSPAVCAEHASRQRGWRGSSGIPYPGSVK